MPHWLRLSGEGEVWMWNSDMIWPTFHPASVSYPGTNRQCHFKIANGKITFLKGTKHRLLFKTVELPDWDTKRLSM